jgi:hypothetical protein
MHFFNEASIELNHFVEHMNILWICRYMHLNYGLDFLRSSSLPYLEIINCSIIPKNTIKVHLCGFRLIPNSLHF